MKKFFSLVEAQRGAYPWITKNGISFTGYIYADGQLITNEEVFNLLEQISGEEEFLGFLREANGFFSVIIEKSNCIFCAVDRVASNALLYKIEEELMIGDDFEEFLNLDAEIDEGASMEFLASGYVYGRRTLLKDVFQLVAGSALIFNKRTLDSAVHKYYEYIPSIPSKVDSRKLEDYVDQLEAVHLKVFSRMVESLSGRQAILPLSGGYDSRLILEMLLRYNHKNLLCVTWGRENDWQVKVAQSVTQALGVNWVRVDQTFEDWNEWANGDNFSAQMRSCGALASIPYLQENVLINFLESRGLVEKDAVFLNGNSGDFIEGEHIPLSIEEVVDEDQIIAIIKNKHMRLNKLTSYESLTGLLKEDIKRFQEKDLDLRLFFEYWEWKERQSKFVTNCVKAFEVSGYEWRMPFWEKEIMEFWENVPVEIKKGRSLFYEYYRKYMNSSVVRPNPKISYFRRYYERFNDPRFGVFFSHPLAPRRLVGKTDKVFSKVALNNIQPDPVFLSKINSLVAIWVFSTVINEVRKS